MSQGHRKIKWIQNERDMGIYRNEHNCSLWLSPAVQACLVNQAKLYNTKSELRFAQTRRGGGYVWFGSPVIMMVRRKEIFGYHIITGTV
jgi:hypothetical protein